MENKKKRRGMLAVLLGLVLTICGGALTLTAAELSHILIQPDGTQAQAVGHFFDFGINDIKAAVFQNMLDLAGFLHQLVDVGIFLAHLVIEGKHFLFQVEHMAECFM